MIDSHLTDSSYRHLVIVSEHGIFCKVSNIGTSLERGTLIIIFCFRSSAISYLETKTSISLFIRGPGSETMSIFESTMQQSLIVSCVLSLQNFISCGHRNFWGWWDIISDADLGYPRIVSAWLIVCILLWNAKMSVIIDGLNLSANIMKPTSTLRQWSAICRISVFRNCVIMNVDSSSKTV